jgi:U3 small nucleolar RNA-associated protein 14
MKKISIDEVRQRQSQLRAMRELMFRQDQKSKRIAKIKSKAYRRIHKREREREAERRIAEDGEELQEKRMKIDAARAKERMTLRHKNTGDWAKKILGRGQHDLETRQAISEQIRRGDDLQRKILGEDEGSGEESDSGEELDDLLNDPNKWGEEQVIEDAPQMRKGIMGMKFMRDAEERQKQVNALQIAEIKAALEAGSDEDEILPATEASAQNSNPGRKNFIPGDQVCFWSTVLISR